MPILINQEKTRFKLDTPHTSYIFGQTPAGQLVQYYYGAHICDMEVDGFFELRSFPDEPVSTGSKAECPNVIPYEYGTQGCGDYRQSALGVAFDAGHGNVDLRYTGYTLSAGKPHLADQPCFFAQESECDTLIVQLEDKAAGLTVFLQYTVFSDLDVIVRSARITNIGKSPLVLKRAMSVSLSMPGANKELIHLPGAWSRERQVEREALTHSVHSYGSVRGVSGHLQNPFVAVVDKACTERAGSAYGVCLAYSGNFIIECENAYCDILRVNCGIAPESFAWTLASGESFATPEAALVYTDCGIGTMSRIFHRLLRRHLCVQAWQNRSRPVVLNNWEATYFDFNAEKLSALAKAAAALKIDLLVMDDGWFGARNGDTAGLGDWVVNEKKLGCTLNELTNQVKQAGTQFGLWIEPEMINEDSELYRTHPDWCFATPNKEKTPSRNQFVLDLTREEVLQYIEKSIAAVLESADIRYVKWDFNRVLTDVYSQSVPPERAGELAHRYTLAQYRLEAFFTNRFPNILFEGCSGGGGRFDAGQLYYFPHIWTSDNMDAIERMKIQFGTSFVYPPSTMAAHVCSSPNHVTGRFLPLETRAICAMMAGEFGYELDITALSFPEKEAVAKQVQQYKAIEALVHSGDFYRLENPFEGNYGAWCFVSEDQSACAVSVIQVLSEPNGMAHRLCLDGLKIEARYRDIATGKEYYGDTLMRAGILLPLQKADFTAQFYYFQMV